MQAKLRAPASPDALEKEADVFASEVVGAGCARCGAPHCDGGCSTGLARKAAPGASSSVATPDLSGLGAGQSLDPGLRTRLEARSGMDMGGVRVHTGPEPSALADKAGARAFTVGRDIVFAPDAYHPGSAEGQELIAHEAAHVVQQGATGPAVQRQPKPAPNASLTPTFAKTLSDADLDAYLDSYRRKLATLDAGSPEATAIQDNLRVLQSEALTRSKGVSVVANDIPRPAGLPEGGGYALQPSNLPSELFNDLPEGQISAFSITPPGLDFSDLALPGQSSVLAAGGFGSMPWMGSSPDDPGFSLKPTDVTSPLAALGVGTNAAANAHLLQYGFNAAGADAIGLVGVPHLFSKGAYLPETVAHLGDYWGHTALYVRQGGKITIVRGFNPAMEGSALVDLLKNFRNIESGNAAVPAAISSDAYLFTYTGSKSIEYPVSAELAEKLSKGLPKEGPVAPKGNIPWEYTARPDQMGKPGQCSNCVLWAAEEAEGALGGAIGPKSQGVSVTSLGKGGAVTPGAASQGRFMRFLKGVSSGKEAPMAVPEALGPAVASGMPRYLQVLKWGGKVFFVIGLATIPLEVYMAPKGQKMRTFLGAAGGFGFGLAAGAAAGLVCGPGAPVCSVVLGLGFGIAGAILGRRAVESIYDAFEVKLKEWKDGLAAIEKHPAMLLAPPMATTLALRGGYGGLLRSPVNVQQDIQYTEYQKMIEQRRQSILAKEQQLAALRAQLLGG